jgi:hypothetical protein
MAVQVIAVSAMPKRFNATLFNDAGLAPADEDNLRQNDLCRTSPPQDISIVSTGDHAFLALLAGSFCLAVIAFG